jgi:hypothetical protein
MEVCLWRKKMSKLPGSYRKAKGCGNCGHTAKDLPYCIQIDGNECPVDLKYADNWTQVECDKFNEWAQGRTGEWNECGVCDEWTPTDEDLRRILINTMEDAEVEYKIRKDDAEETTEEDMGEEE